MDDITVGRFTIPADEVEEEFTTSGGPGGQHANRSNTAVGLRFDVSSSTVFPPGLQEQIVARLGAVVTASSSDSRSQWRNRALARRRLAQKLEEAIKPAKRRRPTSPTRASRRRRLESKRRHSEKKRLRGDPDW
jgi:ribosome-associated protein